VKYGKKNEFIKESKFFKKIKKMLKEDNEKINIVKKNSIFDDEDLFGSIKPKISNPPVPKKNDTLFDDF
jgi:hypothetical protein